MDPKPKVNEDSEPVLSWKNIEYFVKAKPTKEQETRILS
jgi:hypothetical protein